MSLDCIILNKHRAQKEFDIQWTPPMDDHINTFCPYKGQKYCVCYKNANTYFENVQKSRTVEQGTSEATAIVLLSPKRITRYFSQTTNKYSCPTFKQVHVICAYIRIFDLIFRIGH